MTVQYSIQRVLSDGTLSVVPLGIQYLQRDDIFIRIGGEETPSSGAPNGFTWYFLDNNTLKIKPTVPTGVEVYIYRRTDTASMFNVYSQNAQFDESTIDENNQQLLFIAQEYLEQGIPGAGVQDVIYVGENRTQYLYKMRLTDGGITPEFGIPKPNTDILGYNYLGPYATGLVLNSSRDTISKDGRLFARDGAYPYTLTGDFIADGPWIALSTSTGIYLYNFTASAGQTEFTLPHAITPGTVPLVFVRGVYQQSGVAYNVDTSNSRIIRFTSGLLANDSIQVAAMSGADVVSQGNRTAFVFKNSATQPATPVGTSPAGWSLSPSTPSTGEFTYISSGLLSGEYGTLIGTWSTPSRFSGERGASGTNGTNGVNGADGASVQNLELVSKVGATTTYKFLLSTGAYTNTFQVLDGVSVQALELVNKVGKVATYRFLLSSGSYTSTFQVLDGNDGAGSVISVNGVSPNVGGNVTLTAANVGADPSGTATSAVSSHAALADPHSQYEYRWGNTTANTGTINTAKRVRWLVDTSATRNRTIGADVTDLVVKDVTGQAGTNSITITAPAGKTINGAATETIDANYGWVQYVLVGTDFKTIGGR